MTITLWSSFTLYNRQGSVLHFLNPVLRVIVLIYSFKLQRAACTRTYIFFISVNTSLYVLSSASTTNVSSGIFVWISSSSTTYKNNVLDYIVWESLLLINHISTMMSSVISLTTGE